MATSLRYTKEDYARTFVAEQQREYPEIDAFEVRCGYAVDREELEATARILACPVKVDANGHPRPMPLWQHGRVLYAAARLALSDMNCKIMALDIGTAKGFSALMLRRAIDDAGLDGTVVSVDVVDPCARVERNTVADLDGPKTITELMEPFPDTGIRFLQSTGIEWLKGYAARVALAFVDGKHDKPTVLKEGELLAERQQSGDLVVWDDVQLKPVAEAVALMQHAYHIEWVTCSPLRRYAVGRRK